MGLIKGFEAHSGGEMVTHLQFADDMILFTSTNWDEIVTLKRILRCFQMVSGLKINLSKSYLVGVGCSEENIQILATRLHCRKGSLPCQYLGLSIGANP